MSKPITTSFVCLLLLSLTSFGDSDDTSATLDAEALPQTQEVLTNPNLRQRGFSLDPELNRADQTIGSMVGERNKNEVYNISAEVLETLVKQTQGDPLEMQRILDEGAKDPNAFYLKYMNSDQKQKIRDLANDPIKP